MNAKEKKYIKEKLIKILIEDNYNDVQADDITDLLMDLCTMVDLELSNYFFIKIKGDIMIFQILTAKDDDEGYKIKEEEFQEIFDGTNPIEILMEGKLDGEMTLLSMTDILNKYPQITVITPKGREFNFKDGELIQDPVDFKKITEQLSSYIDQL